MKKPNIWLTTAEVEAECSRLRASYPLEFSTLEGNIRARLSMVDDEEIENHLDGDRMIPFFLFKIRDQHGDMHQGYSVNMLGCVIRGIGDQIRSGRN